MARLFFSYSHKDEALRNELEIHLSMLKRQGIIEAWHDRRIGAGKEFEGEISRELEHSEIILLLISPYFLASDYCYDIEMKRALERHESGEARVIPVILHPCDWNSALFGKLMAAPTDGKPVSKHPNQHDAFLDIVTSIRSVAAELGGQVTVEIDDGLHSSSDLSQPLDAFPRSSNLRIRKDFSEQQKDEFLENTFEYISNFFEGSLSELSNRNPEVSSKFKRIDANHFTAIAYRDGNTVTQCKIWLGGMRSFFGGIAYSSDISSSDNTLNDSLSVETDGHILFLKAMGMSFVGGDRENTKLSQEGGAEYFWEVFIRQLQY